MNILHIYKDYFPVLGGMENHIRLLAEAQAKLGHTVMVLVTSPTRASHAENINGVQVIYASRLAAFSSAPFSAEMFHHVSRIHTDVTHLHSPYPFGEIASHFLGHSRATILTYQSDIVRQRVGGVLYRPLLHRILEGVHTIIATSPNYVESSPVLRRWQDKCVVIPLASPLLKMQVIPQTEINDSAGELLFVGRLRYYKGVNYLLEALPLIPDARLTIVGTGPKEREWKNLASALGVTERVKWVGDVTDEELPGYYAACDVFVLPCSERSEAFGAVQLEAMASGKPVVSCDVNTGVAWVNQNGITGLVVPPKDPEALAGAISRLLGDGELRGQLGRAARTRVEKEFTVGKMVEQVLEVYERAIPKN